MTSKVVVSIPKEEKHSIRFSKRPFSTTSEDPDILQPGGSAEFHIWQGMDLTITEEPT